MAVSLRAVVARAAESEVTAPALPRQREQESGVYDFEAMQEAARRPTPYVDAATFAACVEVKPSERHGNGLFVTKNVSVGELLLCEKAFTYCFDNMTTNTHTNAYNDPSIRGTVYDLISTTVQHLLQNPSQIEEFASLYGGDYTSVRGHEVDPNPITDSYIIHKIIAYNSFSFDYLMSHPLRGSTYSRAPDVDFRSSGIYRLAARLNHSCFPNVIATNIGDLLIIRATRAISEGEELTYSYFNPARYTGIIERQEALSPYRFECRCQVCTHDIALSNKKHKKRARQLQELIDAVAGGIEANRMEAIIKEYAKTYTKPATEVPRMDIYDQYLQLSRWYAQESLPFSTVRMLEDVLSALGFVVEQDFTSFKLEKWGLHVEDLMEVWMRLWTAYAWMFRWEACKEVKGCARISWRILGGLDGEFERDVGDRVRVLIDERRMLEGDLAGDGTGGE